MKTLHILYVIAIMCLLSGRVYGAETIDELRQLIEANHRAHQESLNHIWMMVATVLVMLMQGGFLLLEAGMSRSKNSINASQKNIIDFLLTVFIFYLFGFAMMFGVTHGGWFGWDSSLSAFRTTENWNYTFFIFHAVFAGTAATIVSGAIAERTKLSGYIWITVVIAAFVYPVVGHWGWGNLLHTDNESYLIKNGFIDFAGSTIVHSVGAWVALAACIVIGPRVGRFDPETGRVKRMEGHSLVLSAVGCIILWVGWIGFNGGSTSVGSPEFASIIFNTIIASIFAGISALLLGYLKSGFFRPDQTINGILAGLVAITAGCSSVDGWGAAFIGGSAAILMHYSCISMVKHARIDDVVGAVSVHGICGAWGTVLVAFFATEEALGGLSVWQQFSIQCQGVLIVFAWAFGVSYIALKLLDSVIGLRVSTEDEIAGLNVAEHHATLGIGLLKQHLEDVVDGTQDLTKRISIDNGDESEEIAYYINRFIGQMQELMRTIGREAYKLENHSCKMSDISSILATSSQSMSVQSDEVTEVNQNMADETSKIAQLVGTMGERIDDASGSAKQMSANMQNVSDAIYDLTKSIHEVEQKSGKASNIANEANNLTQKASRTVGALSEAAVAIGGVVELIKRIASQTNLLALNATIEASRAGESGKGFAVVASEVKTLASQTAKATEEIEERIGNIQSSSYNVSDIINEVTEIIDSINEAVTTISTITTNQNTAANEISQNVSQTTNETIKVTDSIETISQNVREIAEGGDQAAQNASALHSSMKIFTEEAHKSSQNAQDTRSASYEVRTISRKLSEAVEQYKTENPLSSDST